MRGQEEAQLNLADDNLLSTEWRTLRELIEGMVSPGSPEGETCTLRVAFRYDQGG